MTEPAPGPSASGDDGRWSLLDGVRLGAVIAVVAAAAVVAWLILKDDDDGEQCGNAVPRASTPQDLRSFAQTVDIPVYWAGTRPGVTYELTETPRCNVYIRYLPRGVEVGNRRPDYTTIGTYPYKNA